MPRTLTRSTASGTVDRATLTQQFKDFLLTQNTIKGLTKRATELKKSLTEAVEAMGEEDEKGHLLLPVEGVDGYAAMQRQRKVSTSLNQEALDRVLEAKGLRDRCYKLVPMLDEDEVYAAFAEGAITEEELDTIFPKSVSYAFLPIKA